MKYYLVNRVHTSSQLQMLRIPFVAILIILFAEYGLHSLEKEENKSGSLLIDY